MECQADFIYGAERANAERCACTEISRRNLSGATLYSCACPRRFGVDLFGKCCLASYIYIRGPVPIHASNVGRCSRCRTCHEPRRVNLRRADIVYTLGCIGIYVIIYMVTTVSVLFSTLRGIGMTPGGLGEPSAIHNAAVSKCSRVLSRRCLSTMRSYSCATNERTNERRKSLPPS